MSNYPGNDRRAEALERLDKTNTLIVKELGAIRVNLTNRPTRAELNERRHTAAIRLCLAFLLLVFVAVQFEDVHVEACGPGARSEVVLNAILSGRIGASGNITTADIRAVGGKGKSNFGCDSFFPTHTHGGGSWPSSWNLVGLLGYATIGGLGTWAVTRRWNFGPGEPKEELEPNK